MLFAVIFLIAFIVIAAFAFYLSRTIEHGEARFDASGRLISDREPPKDATIRPARRIEDTETTEGEQ
jgi:hypothetical protein